MNITQTQWRAGSPQHRSRPRCTGADPHQNHVIESADRVRVALADGRTLDATVAGADAGADPGGAAGLRRFGPDPGDTGLQRPLHVGDAVLAFGSPLGLAGTVTAGIVSAVDRTVVDGGTSLSGLIQTDAPVNPGSSGGARVDSSGRVVGITVAIATTGQGSGNIGVGFAIPVDTAAAVAAPLAGVRPPARG